MRDSGLLLRERSRNLLPINPLVFLVELRFAASIRARPSGLGGASAPTKLATFIYIYILMESGLLRRLLVLRHADRLVIISRIELGAIGAPGSILKHAIDLADA
jgi:hypothetical protein